LNLGLRDVIKLCPKKWGQNSSTNAVHIRENTELYDFSLTPDEMKKIDSLDKGKTFGG